MSDFNSKQGGSQKNSATEAQPRVDGVPTTGFTEAPKGECVQTEVGKGTGNSRRGIH